ALEVLDARSDHRQGRSEFVAGVGRELALAAERFANRDEGMAGVDCPDDHRPDEAEEPDAQEHGEQRTERPLLARRVLNDLNEERLRVSCDRLGEHPEWRSLHSDLANVAL